MRMNGKTPPGFYQQLFKVPSGEGPTTVTIGGGKGGKPRQTISVAPFKLPQTYRDFSKLEKTQKQAYMEAYPDGIKQLQMVQNQPQYDQGYGPGGRNMALWGGG